MKMTLDKQIDILWKAINKQGKYIENLEIIVAHLKKDSHPPVFTKEQYDKLDERVKTMEAFFDNIYEITTILNKENDDGMVN